MLQFFVYDQDIDEVNLEDYKHGGINITGFKIVDFTSAHTKNFLEGWSIMDSESWIGAGRNKVSVSSHCCIAFTLFVTVSGSIPYQ